MIEVHTPSLDGLEPLEEALFRLYLRFNGFNQPNKTEFHRDYAPTDRVSELLKKQEEAKVLDLGSCDGYALGKLKERCGNGVYTVALDIRRPKNPKKAVGLVDEFVVSPMEFLPPEWNDTFDMVISKQSIRYSMFPFRVISEIARALRPRGQGVNIGAVMVGDWLTSFSMNWDEWVSAAQEYRGVLPDAEFAILENPVAYGRSKVEEYHRRFDDETTRISQLYQVAIEPIRERKRVVSLNFSKEDG